MAGLVPPFFCATQIAPVLQRKSDTKKPAGFRRRAFKNFQSLEAEADRTRIDLAGHIRTADR